MPAAISVENVSKKFAHSLGKAMHYGFADIFRDTLGITAHPERLRPDEFWGVQDATFEVLPGECVGLLGQNGAGKSTMLKMINGIIAPDTGRIVLNGRVGALIEVGAGFHPLLTGRENIYVNGAILGLSKREVSARLDSIVAFAGIEEFLDTPVKFYSSGMFVRLGFSVAAHVNPEILLVDEVLAVGDFQFRAKCFTYLNELMRQGTAVVFVSHNFEAIRRMCTRCHVFDHGAIVHSGDPYEAVEWYQIHAGRAQWPARQQSVQSEERAGTGEVEITGLRFLNAEGEAQDTFITGERVTIAIDYTAHMAIEEPVFAVLIEDVEQNVLHALDTRESGAVLGTIGESGTVTVTYPHFNLLGGQYVVSAAINRPGSGVAPYDTCFRKHALYCRSARKDRGRLLLETEWAHNAHNLPKANE